MASQQASGLLLIIMYKYGACSGSSHQQEPLPAACSLSGKRTYALSHSPLSVSHEHSHQACAMRCSLTEDSSPGLHALCPLTAVPSTAAESRSREVRGHRPSKAVHCRLVGPEGSPHRLPTDPPLWALSWVLLGVQHACPLAFNFVHY